MPRGRALLACAIAILAASKARAQELSPALGGRRQMVVSAERLFGVVHASRSWGAARNVAPLDQTGAAVGPLGGATPALFAQPRLSFDAFAFERVSVGVGLSYYRGTVDQTIDSPFAFQQPGSRYAALLLAPRVGYAVPLGGRATLCPRLGFTYEWVHSTGAASETFGLYAVTAEALLAVRIFEQALVMVGPTFDRTFKGATTWSAADAPPVPNRQLDETDIGVACGVGGYF
jgi:hypothetical protein